MTRAFPWNCGLRLGRGALGLTVAGLLVGAALASTPPGTGAARAPGKAPAGVLTSPVPEAGKEAMMSTGRKQAHPFQLGRMWEALARARVMVRLGELGAERAGGKLRGRFGWIESLFLLHQAIAGDETLLGRFHELVVRQTASPGAALAPGAGPDDPVVLLLDFALRERPGLAGAPAGSHLQLALPPVARIRSVLEALGPRPRLDRYEFDNRFPLFLAKLGLGWSLLDPDARDSSGRLAFHELFAEYGPVVEKLEPRARPPGERFPVSGSQLQNLVDAVAAVVDPRYHPQLELRPGRTADAGFALPRRPTFPFDAPHLLYLYLQYRRDAGTVVAPGLDWIDARMGAFLGRLAPLRGKPAGKAILTSEWSCSQP